MLPPVRMAVVRLRSRSRSWRSAARLAAPAPSDDVVGVGEERAHRLLHLVVGHLHRFGSAPARIDVEGAGVRACGRPSRRRARVVTRVETAGRSALGSTARRPAPPMTTTPTNHLPCGDRVRLARRSSRKCPSPSRSATYTASSGGAPRRNSSAYVPTPWINHGWKDGTRLPAAHSAASVPR